MVILNTDFWLSLLTLTALEIVLGVDNLVFISIISSRVKLQRQKLARRLGLAAALITRLLLLGSVFWLTKLSKPLFSLFNLNFSWRDLILIAGGLFLLVKATLEIHDQIEGEKPIEYKPKHLGLFSAITQIMIFDIIFSLDSILTAIGLTKIFFVMALAICIAIAVMIFASEGIHHFIEKYPTIKMLALSFLLLIGVMLIGDGFSFHIPREYIYFAIAFSVFVEFLNQFSRRKKK
jgi:predicted tellurium resistance membrane protein TerC